MAEVRKTIGNQTIGSDLPRLELQLSTDVHVPGRGEGWRGFQVGYNADMKTYAEKLRADEEAKRAIRRKRRMIEGWRKRGTKPRHSNKY